VRASTVIWGLGLFVAAIGCGGSTGGSGGAGGAAAGKGGGAGAGVGGASGRAGSAGASAGSSGTAGSASSLGDAGCDAGPTSLPALTTGYWLIFNAMNTMGAPYYTCSGGTKCVWDGSILTFTSVSPTCGGATVKGTFHWVTTDGVGNGNTVFNGTYDSANGELVLDEYKVTQDISGSIVQAQDTVTYDSQNDALDNGSWTCTAPCSPGVWSARHIQGADASVPDASGDAGAIR
jgi:hypothetical protein